MDSSNIRHLFSIALIIVTSGCSNWISKTHRQDAQITGDLAAAELAFPPLQAATLVQYAQETGGLQNLERFIRLELPPGKVESTVSELIKFNNSSYSRNLNYEAHAIHRDLYPSIPKSLAPIEWWNPIELESVGTYRGEENSFALNIWYGNIFDFGVIYIYQAD